MCPLVERYDIEAVAVRRMAQWVEGNRGVKRRHVLVLGKNVVYKSLSPYSAVEKEE
jgi:hypothetical protein